MRAGRELIGCCDGDIWIDVEKPLHMFCLGLGSVAVVISRMIGAGKDAFFLFVISTRCRMMLVGLDVLEPSYDP